MCLHSLFIQDLTNDHASKTPMSKKGTEFQRIYALFQIVFNCPFNAIFFDVLGMQLFSCTRLFSLFLLGLLFPPILMFSGFMVSNILLQIFIKLHLFDTDLISFCNITCYKGIQYSCSIVLNSDNSSLFLLGLRFPPISILSGFMVSNILLPIFIKLHLFDTDLISFCNITC